MKSGLIISKKYRASFDFSIARRLLAVFLISGAIGLMLVTQPRSEKIPEMHQLKEISSVTARKSVGKNKGLIFEGTQIKNGINQNFSWFVSKHDFNENIQVDLIVDNFLKKNQQMPISISVFEGNEVKKVWGIRFGSIEVMSFERAKKTFEIDERLSRIWSYAALLLVAFAVVTMVRFEKIVINGDEE